MMFIEAFLEIPVRVNERSLMAADVFVQHEIYFIKYVL